MKVVRLRFDGSNWIEEVVDLRKIEKEVDEEEIEKMFVRGEEIAKIIQKGINPETAKRLYMYGFEV